MTPNRSCISPLLIHACRAFEFSYAKRDGTVNLELRAAAEIVLVSQLNRSTRVWHRLKTSDPSADCSLRVLLNVSNEVENNAVADSPVYMCNCKSEFCSADAEWP